MVAGLVLADRLRPVRCGLIESGDQRRCVRAATHGHPDQERCQRSPRSRWSMGDRRDEVQEFLFVTGHQVWFDTGLGGDSVEPGVHPSHLFGVVIVWHGDQS